MQSRLGSFVESWVNILIGFTVNYGANIILLPLFYGAVAKDLGKAFWLGCIFTIISLVRSYIIRRFFNGLPFWNTEELTMSRQLKNINGDLARGG